MLPLECTACVIVKRRPSTSTVPPLFMLSSLAPGTPCDSSQFAASKIATTRGRCRLELDEVADVVGVSVRERDDVHALGFLLGFRTARVREPRVQVDPLAARRVESEGAVAEPRQLDPG